MKFIIGCLFGIVVLQAQEAKAPIVGCNSFTFSANEDPQIHARNTGRYQVFLTVNNRFISLELFNQAAGTGGELLPFYVVTGRLNAKGHIDSWFVVWYSQPIHDKLFLFFHGKYVFEYSGIRQSPGIFENAAGYADGGPNGKWLLHTTGYHRQEQIANQQLQVGLQLLTKLRSGRWPQQLINSTGDFYRSTLSKIWKNEPIQMRCK